jgi:hypothetical protein
MAWYYSSNFDHKFASCTNLTSYSLYIILCDISDSFDKIKEYMICHFWPSSLLSPAVCLPSCMSMVALEVKGKKGIQDWDVTSSTTEFYLACWRQAG